MTKTEYEAELNDLEIPSQDLKSKGGRIPDNAKLGTWLRRHDPVAFQVGFGEWRRERQDLMQRVKRKMDAADRGDKAVVP